jgi:hypothetical protein
VANRRPSAETVVRVNFQVAVSVNPLLASDLKRFTLGRSRHARLLALAMIGLMSERTKLDSASSLPNLDQAGKASAQMTPNRPKACLADRDFAEIGE